MKETKDKIIDNFLGISTLLTIKPAVRTINLRQARQLALYAHREVETRLEQDRASEAQWTNITGSGESDEA